MLKLVKITRRKTGLHELVIEKNGISLGYSVEYSEVFVPHISNVSDKLRAFLVNNPQANQEIIRAIQDFNAGEFLPINVTEWQEVQEL